MDKLHLHFHHRSYGKLFKLMEQFIPEETPPAVLDTLKKIWDACSTCRELHAPASRFRFSIPEDDFRFNAHVAMDLVWV